MYRNFDYRPKNGTYNEQKKYIPQKHNHSQRPANKKDTRKDSPAGNYYNSFPMFDFSDIKRQIISSIASQNPLLAMLLGGRKPDMSGILSDMMKKGGFMR